MSKSYKANQDKYWDVPRVPSWARVQRPEQIIETKKRKLERQKRKERNPKDDRYDGWE